MSRHPLMKGCGVASAPQGAPPCPMLAHQHTTFTHACASSPLRREVLQVHLRCTLLHCLTLTAPMRHLHSLLCLVTLFLGAPATRREEGFRVHTPCLGHQHTTFTHCCALSHLRREEVLRLHLRCTLLHCLNMMKARSLTPVPCHPIPWCPCNA